MTTRLICLSPHDISTTPARSFPSGFSIAFTSNSELSIETKIEIQSGLFDIIQGSYLDHPKKPDPYLINKIILDHIGQNNKIIEDSGNFVLLTGYLNSDLLQEQEGPYNLPLFEIKNALELGQLTSFIQISRKDIKQTEDEIPQEIIIEKPKKEIKEDAEGEEGNAEGEEEPQEEENPDGVPKFKPENFKWTSYDGQPRNYVQVLKRLKMFPVNIIKSDKCREELIKEIKKHLDNFGKKEENKYEGIISIINVGENINEETDEIVNELCNIDVINEEEEVIEEKEKEKEKSQNDKDVKKSAKK